MEYYAYILESLVDDKFYYGSTQNIQDRVDRHNEGRVDATRHRRPFKLIGYFLYRSREEALRQELYLKKSRNRQYVLRLLAEYGVIV